MTGSIICFGELLLRMSAPGNERIMQSSQFGVHVGGAEANVAVSLSQFKHDTKMVSALPNNVLGDAIIRDLKSHGIQTEPVLRGQGRVGLYFLETGAVQRPSRIVYDRTDSTFTTTPAESYDWDSLLDEADWLHISGITPATGLNAARAALDATSVAKERGVKVSFDGNYREQLWKSWSGDGPRILAELLDKATLAFINELDINLILGTQYTDRSDAEHAAFERFSALTYIASTQRQQASANHHMITGRLATRADVTMSVEMDMPNIVDRIGGGDAFAAGILHGLIEDMPPRRIVDFGIAAAAIKHSVPGDYNRACIEEVEDLLSQNGLDVRR